MDLSALSTLKPVGQIRDSFILAVNPHGLWIIDQHVAHERVLFEKVLRARLEMRVESQRLLMPLIVELTPQQLAVFAELSEELQRNGFEAEPFGSRTLAVKTAPAGIDPGDSIACCTSCWNSLKARSRRSTWKRFAPALPPASPATPQSRSILRSIPLKWSGCFANWPVHAIP